MDERLWKECGEFHGHTCPGLAIGYRLTEAAMDFLRIPLEKAKDEELVCIAENEACGVDAVQVLLSCTAGKGNLIFRPKGKIAFTFFDRRTGKGVRVMAKQFPRVEDRAQMIKNILEGPLDTYVTIGAPREGVPSKARHFETVVCSKCGEGCREDKARLSNGEIVCPDCFEFYDRG